MVWRGVRQAHWGRQARQLAVRVLGTGGCRDEGGRGRRAGAGWLAVVRRAEEGSIGCGAQRSAAQEAPAVQPPVSQDLPLPGGALFLQPGPRRPPC